MPGQLCRSLHCQIPGREHVDRRNGRHTALFQRGGDAGGLACGAALCAASAFQQFGIAIDASAGDAGFITALYILIVPIIKLLFGSKIGIKTWIGVALALFGFYLLTEKFGGFTLGCLLVLISAFLFAVHILVVDYFAGKADGVRLSCIQFFVCAVISGVLMLIFEKPSFADIWAAKSSILYAGAMSSGVGYTLQILAQKGSNPTVISLLLSLESVFATISGAAILGDRLSGREYFGCALMLAAVVLAQLPDRKKA